MSSNTSNEYDVVCGRGRSTYVHPGNKRFRVIIERNIEKYSNATSRLEKSQVVSDICKEVRRKGDFVQRSPDGQSIKVTERMAREKCGQGLRDSLHNKYRSSTQAKQVRRKNDLEEEAAKISNVIRSNEEIGSVLDQLKGDLKARDDLTDSTVQVMFTTANSRILEELKASRIAFSDPEETFSASTPSSTCRDLSPRPLTRKVTAEQEHPQTPSPVAWRPRTSIVVAHVVQV